MSTFLPQLFLFAVLALFLVVGFLYKKRPKNIEEYALGNKKN